MAFDAELRLADVSSRGALRYGVTADIGADRDHTPSHQFAAPAADAGFDGVCWWVRHEPAPRLRGVALFDRLERRRPGAFPRPAPGNWTPGSSTRRAGRSATGCCRIPDRERLPVSALVGHEDRQRFPNPAEGLPGDRRLIHLTPGASQRVHLGDERVSLRILRKLFERGVGPVDEPVQSPGDRKRDARRDDSVSVVAQHGKAQTGCRRRVLACIPPRLR